MEARLSPRARRRVIGGTGLLAALVVLGEIWLTHLATVRHAGLHVGVAQYAVLLLGAVGLGALGAWSLIRPEAPDTTPKRWSTQASLVVIAIGLFTSVAGTSALGFWAILPGFGASLLAGLILRLSYA